MTSENQSQTKFTHFLISSFQICPGRQNLEGTVPLLGHSGSSFPKTEEEKTKKNIDATTYRMILLIYNSLYLIKNLVLFYAVD